MKGGTFLYPALLKTLLLPPILCFIFIHILPSLPIFISLLLYALSWPTLFIFRSHLAAWICSYKAHQLGARDIPRVKGKSVLNFDVLLDWSRSGTEEEAGRMMVLLGRKYGGTYNTRVLGEDSVGCSFGDHVKVARESGKAQESRWMTSRLMCRSSRRTLLCSVMYSLTTLTTLSRAESSISEQKAFSGMESSTRMGNGGSLFSPF